MKFKKKPEKVFATLTDWDLPDMKAMINAWLDLNIAIKKFNKRKAETDEQIKMSEESIANSLDGKRNVEKIQNPETLNALMQKIPMRDHMTINAICAFISGSTADKRMLATDEQITATKRESRE